MQLQSLIPKFEGKRVRIVYDVAYPTISLLYGHILPYFNSKKLIFIVYADFICRRLREMYRSMNSDNLPVTSQLNNANLIKIGKKECFPFVNGECVGSGRLTLISEESIFDDFESVDRIAVNITNENVTVLAGLYLLPAVYGFSAIESIYRIFCKMPEDATVFSFYPNGFLDKHLNKSLEKLYDVIIRVKREDELFYFGEEMYLIGIEQSIIKDIKPGYARYRIGEEWNLLKV
jgi:hypothetical protein